MLFFPYIGYWQFMNMSDAYNIFDNIQYIKNLF
ncbi:WbqC family protein [Hydrogenimonas sp.]